MPDTSTSELDLRAILGPVAEEVEHPADRRADDGIGAVLQLPAHRGLLLDGRGPGDPLTASQILTANPYWTLANMDNEIHVVQSTAVAVLADKAMEGRRVGNALGRGANQHPDPADRLLARRSRDGAGGRTGVRERLPHVPNPGRGRRVRPGPTGDPDADRRAPERPRGRPGGPRGRPGRSSDETVAANEVDTLSSRPPEHPGRVAGLARHHARHADPAGRGPGDAIEPGPPPGRGPGLRRRTGARGGVRVHARADGRPDPRSAQLVAAVGAPVLAVVPKVSAGASGPRRGSSRPRRPGARPPKPTARFGRTRSSSRATPACGSSR